MVWSFSSSSLLFLLLFRLLILLQLPWPTPAPCHTATRAECRRQERFVPGWELAGEGIDITTLHPTGYFPVDTHKFTRPDGTCTLCRNDLQEGQLQRLPLAITDWRSQSPKCQRNVVKNEASSVVEVAAQMSKKIKNDWKVGLDVQPKPNVNVHMSLSGSHSKEAQFAAEKKHLDEYSFTTELVQCQNYRFHLVEKPPLSREFIQAVRALPLQFNASTRGYYFRLIKNYGTHFLKAVELGGRVTDITALRTCKLSLDGLKANEVSSCLKVEAAVTVGTSVSTADAEKCLEKKKNHNIRGSFHSTYNERQVDIEGGALSEGSSDLLFSDHNGSEKFTEWMSTLSSKPGLLAYALEPLHFLLGSKNPQREELRKAVSDYILHRARWQDCNKPCPPGQRKSPQNPCHCVCQASTLTNGDCCPRERGLAHLEVTGLSARNLHGDTFSNTDGYIKAFFGDKELRTYVVWNDNNPKWDQNLDFGAVQLITGGPLRLQVWDADHGWDDDLLGSCDRVPVAGGRRKEQCHFSRGFLTFHYQVTCAPHLKGDKCLEYAPRGALGEPVGNRSGAVW
ncbi:perforin-1 [Gracilinanus agilis]|uniref:perforin-1 n=1 Tax=Gracilinanus agilis TaxID=191870 RepID=UPI001CFF5047|nr:perforin-1 [Gracilinanus agilis]